MKCPLSACLRIKFTPVRSPLSGLRATSQAPKRQARRGSQLVLMNLLTFLFQHLSSDLEYFYLKAAGLQKDRRDL